MRNMAATLHFYVSDQALVWAAIWVVATGVSPGFRWIAEFVLAAVVLAVLEALALQAWMGVPIRLVTAERLFAVRRALAERIFRGEVDVEEAMREYRQTVGVCAARDQYCVMLFAQAYLARLVHEESARLEGLCGVLGANGEPRTTVH